MAMVYWALNSYEREPTYGYKLKKNAVDIMESSIEVLRSESIADGISTGEDSLSFGWNHRVISCSDLHFQNLI